MDFLQENSVFVFVVTSVVTVLLVILSTFYIFKNASKAKAGDPVNLKATANTTETADHPGLGSASEKDDTSKPKQSWDSSGCPADGKKASESSPDGSKKQIDPVQYCEHIQSEVKKARQRAATREIEQNLTEEDVIAEREAQRKQLEDIFKLMEVQNEKFGVKDMDEVYQQMKLYA